MRRTKCVLVVVGLLLVLLLVGQLGGAAGLLRAADPPKPLTAEDLNKWEKDWHDKLKEARGNPLALEAAEKEKKADFAKNYYGKVIEITGTMDELHVYGAGVDFFLTPSDSKRRFTVYPGNLNDPTLSKLRKGQNITVKGLVADTSKITNATVTIVEDPPKK